MFPTLLTSTLSISFSFPLKFYFPFNIFSLSSFFSIFLFKGSDHSEKSIFEFEFEIETVESSAFSKKLCLQNFFKLFLQFIVFSLLFQLRIQIFEVVKTFCVELIINISIVFEKSTSMIY